MITLCKHIGNARVSRYQEPDGHYWKTEIFCPTTCLFEGRFCPFGMFRFRQPLFGVLSFINAFLCTNIYFYCIPESSQDIVQGRPSRFPLSSQELFEILDNASEKTFLCGTSFSMQKYIFDGGTVKIGLETKNLVACMSFLLEEKLVSYFPLIFGTLLIFCLVDSSALFWFTMY